MFQAALARLRDPTAPICTSELAGRHTAVIESIHRQATIVTVAPSQISWSAAPNAEAQEQEIFRLAEALRRSYVTERSLAGGGFNLTKLS